MNAKKYLTGVVVVIVPDLRGAGDSGKPEAGYDKKNMAVDIHELVRSPGVHRVQIAGHINQPVVTK